MVRQGESGYLTPPEDAPALAEGLLRVVRDPVLRAAMGRSSFDLFLREFHASAMAEKVEAVYRAVLAGHPSRNR
jgi:glycosyltransferase involved in cell wall biosynthesis